MTQRMTGKVAIVTGGTSGLGAAISRRFGAEGVSVIVTGRNAVRGKAVTEAIGANGGEASFVACDLGDEASIQALMEESVGRYGKLDSIVLSGAATATGTNEREVSILDLDNDILEESISTNVRGLLWMYKYALPHLVAAARPAQRVVSSIVTISSSGTRNGAPGMPAYWATKAPIEVMTRSIAREFGGRGVRANCVSSGLVLTESEAGAMTQEFKEMVLGLNCLPYFGEPEDIASACVYLCSDESCYVTGVTLCVNGGAAF